MIDVVGLKNFKRFRSLELELRALTLLAGLNGMGKSTVIQSLLVLRQSARSGDLAGGLLDLAGELVDLGTGRDVLFDGADDDELAITLGWGEGGRRERMGLKFAYDATSDQLRLIGEAGKKAATPSPATIPLSGVGVQYLCAERLGPRKALPLSESRLRSRDIGKQGEFVLQVLIALGEMLLNEADPRILRAESTSVRALAGAWLAELSPGVRLSIDPVRAIDAAVASYAYAQPGDVPTTGFRPTNVGFGLSYTLPVIVACLIARPGDLLLIENPEAHVHPRGQTLMGDLLARTASAGVQVLVETHSDHVMNGVRIAVHGRRLRPEQVAFHYFEQDGAESRVISPQLDENGRLDAWPTGFFDQHEDNLAQLIAPAP
jgi:predicted ATPase